MLRKLITNSIYLGGVPWVIRTLFLRDRVTIIYYHSISPTLFEKHIVFIKKWFSVIPLQSYISSPKTTPKWSLVITLDDGHQSNYLLLDIIKKYNIPVTIFLTTQIVGYNRQFWFKNVDSELKEILKRISDEERVKRLLEMGVDDTLEEIGKGDGLSIEQINEMKPYVDFQSHTCTHPILPNCSCQKSEYEIRQSKIEVELLTGKPCYALAFPNGDYAERELLFAKQSNYSCVLACNNKTNKKNSSFLLYRISASDNSSNAELALRISRIWFFIKRFI